VTLGQVFKQKREASGRSLEQLAALTKIHIKILTALENDAYVELPARAFTRGFIVNYAKALKLNPDELLSEHKDFLEARFGERIDRDLGHQGYVFEGKELEQTRRWMVIGASIAVVFAGATLFIFKPQNHHHKEQHKEFEEEATLDPDSTPMPSLTPGSSAASAPATTVAIPAANSTGASTSSTTTSTATLASVPVANSAISLSTASPTLTATATPTGSPSATPSPTPTAAKEDKLNKGDGLDPKEVKFKITFQAKDDVWIRYKSDAKPANLLLLRKNRYLAIKAKNSLIFEVAHPEALQYKTKSSYLDLIEKKAQVGSDASLKEYDGSDFGSSEIPETIPASPTH
jgi:cytoskeletal protein RodZ